MISKFLLVGLFPSLLMDMWVTPPPEGVDALNPLPKHRVPMIELPETKGPPSSWRSWSELDHEPVPQQDDPRIEDVGGYGKSTRDGLGTILVWDFYGHQMSLVPLSKAGRRDADNRLRYDIIASLVYALENDTRLNKNREAARLMHHLTLHGPWGVRVMNLLLGQTRLKGADLHTLRRRLSWMNPHIEALFGKTVTRLNANSQFAGFLAEPWTQGWDELNGAVDTDTLVNVANDTTAPLILRMKAAERLSIADPPLGFSWALKTVSEDAPLLQLQAVRVLRRSGRFKRFNIDEIPNPGILYADIVFWALECGGPFDCSWVYQFHERFTKGDQQGRQLNDLLRAAADDPSSYLHVCRQLESTLDDIRITWYRRAKHLSTICRATKEPPRVKAWTNTVQNAGRRNYVDIEGQPNILGPVPIGMSVLVLARCPDPSRRLKALKILFPGGTLQAITLSPRSVTDLADGKHAGQFHQHFDSHLAHNTSYTVVPLKMQNIQLDFIEALDGDISSAELKWIKKRLADDYLDRKVRHELEKLVRNAPQIK